MIRRFKGLNETIVSDVKISFNIFLTSDLYALQQNIHQVQVRLNVNIDKFKGRDFRDSENFFLKTV